MKKRMKLLMVGLFAVIASCAVITVNIYFPEKDVKEAYKVLEKELMAPDKSTDDKKPEEAKPEGKPESRFMFEFVSTACAQEAGMSNQIADIVRRMPDVVNAYREMGARISDTDRLRDAGLVGEGKAGLLVERDKGLSPADRRIMDSENSNRQTVINGMAKAIIRLNRQPETPDTLRQVVPQATDQFSAIRRDAAKRGWWIQDPSGNWTKK